MEREQAVEFLRNLANEIEKGADASCWKTVWLNHLAYAPAMPDFPAGPRGAVSTGQTLIVSTLPDAIVAAEFYERYQLENREKLFPVSARAAARMSL